jgi:acyl carrier protein
MSHQQFRAATKPKVQGSWNLHEVLPKKMDFFIMLSSIISITGNHGQSNYAAGNTYQGALARYRVFRGLPAAAIDLGGLDTVGYVAEHLESRPALSKTLDKIKNSVLSDDDLHSITEYHIDPRTPKDSETRSEIIIGLTSSFAKHVQDHPLLTTLSESRDSVLPQGDATTEFPIRALLNGAKTTEDAVGLISKGIQHKLVSVMSLSEADIDTRKSLQSYGVDSLVAVEFRDWITKEIGAQVATVDIIGTKGIAEFSAMVAGLSRRGE